MSLSKISNVFKILVGGPIRNFWRSDARSIDLSEISIGETPVEMLGAYEIFEILELTLQKKSVFFGNKLQRLQRFQEKVLPTIFCFRGIII